MSAWDDLRVAMEQFNATERAELTEFGLTYLGDNGPAFLAGEVRMRGLFIDTDGKYWTDACLVVESAYLNHPAYDYYADQPGGTMQPGHDLWVFSAERGRHNAIIVPLGEICDRLDLPEAEPFPGDNWVRSWRTQLDVTDQHEIGLVAYGIPR